MAEGDEFELVRASGRTQRSWFTTRLVWALAPLGRSARDAPFLLLIASFLIAVVWGALTEIGAPSLFWHEHPSEQLLAGIAAAVLAWELAFIGYLLASCEPGWCDENSAEGWLVRTALPFVLVLGLAPLGPFAPRPWVWFVVGLLIGSLAVLGLRRLARALLRRTMLIERVPERSWFRLPRFEHHLQLVYFAGMLLGYVGVTLAIWLGAEPKIPAAAAICLGLGLIAGVYGFVRFNFERHRVLIYFGIFLAFAGVQALTFGRTHRLDTPGLDYAAPVDLARPPPPNPTLLDDRQVLERWRSRFDHPPRLVVIASSGGGLRASLWTARVLTELEAGIPDFADHVRLVTGASGGMVGAGIWVATLLDEGHGDHDVVDESGREALGPITLHLTMPLPGDRGEALDQALVDNSEGALAIGLRELSDDEALGRRPSLVYAPIMVEDGRPMLFSNLELEALCSVGLGDAAPTTLALEFYRLFPAADPPLATLARLSASAPLVSPAVQIPTLPSRSLNDAGFADPYGVDLATRWIARHADWLRANTAGVVLVQIRDRRESWREVALVRPHPWLWRAIAQFAAPGESIVRSRRSTIGFRNELQIAHLANDLPSLTTVVFELDAEASLSWSLSEREKEAILAAIHSPENQRVLTELRTWWTETEPSARASANDDSRSQRELIAPFAQP